MALMYELLALKQPINHEAEARATNIKGIQQQIKERKKLGQTTRGLWQMLSKLQAEEKLATFSSSNP